MVRGIKKLSDWYFRNERWLSSFGLVGGFLFDIFTLTRVDETLENIWVGFHLIIAAVGIIFINLYEEGKLKAKVPGRAHFWWAFVIQFAFGGLFSVYLVFYSRSASFFASWPFLLILLINFLANERLRERYARTDFQITMLFLGTLFYFIYIIPIILGEISTIVFLLSGVVSLIFMAIFVYILAVVTPKRLWSEKWILIGSVIGSYLLINVLYFTHLIPPIPLSLKEATVTHHVSKNAGYSYTLLEEVNDKPWYQYFLRSETIHLVSGSPAYVYTAIFAPARINTPIVHKWQYYDASSKKWIDSSVIPLSIKGGREEGFRTFSYKSNLKPGRWRVSVDTATGQTIGRLVFLIEPATYNPILKEVTK